MSKKQQSPLPDEALSALPAAACHFVYLLSCADSTLYTGYTTNIERRLSAHNAGKGARYTRGRRPVTLVAYWAFPTKEEAWRAEYAMKRLSHAQKLQLAQRANRAEEIKQGGTPLCAAAKEAKEPSSKHTQP